MIKYSECPYCKSGYLQKYAKNNSVTLSECKGCRLIFMNPMFEPAELFKIYKGYYTSIKEINHVQFGYDNYERVRSYDVMEEQYYPWFSEYANKEGRVLDIGCGTGNLMEVLRDYSYDVYGLEVSEDTHGVLQGKGFSFYKSDIQSASLDKYDYIVMIDVLEHLFTPFADLKKVYSALNDNGMIFIETINSDAFRVPRLWRNSWVAISPVHLYYWGEEILIRVLKDQGFDVISVRTYPKSKIKAWIRIGNLIKRVLRYVGIGSLFGDNTLRSEAIKSGDLRPMYGILQTIRIVGRKM